MGALFHFVTRKLSSAALYKLGSNLGTKSCAMSLILGIVPPSGAKWNCYLLCLCLERGKGVGNNQI